MVDLCPGQIWQWTLSCRTTGVSSRWDLYKSRRRQLGVVSSSGHPAVWWDVKLCSFTQSGCFRTISEAMHCNLICCFAG